MDNAQKAIMIGVGLFITIIVISAVLLITNMGTDLITTAKSQMSGISQSLQGQVTAAFDGKTVTGADVITACQQYENSAQLSVVVVSSNNNKYGTGKYQIKLAEAVENKVKAGGVRVTYTGSNGAYVELTGDTKHSMAKIQDSADGGVSSTQTYYSYVMKDKDSNTVMGILFVRKGVNDLAANTEIGMAS